MLQLPRSCTFWLLTALDPAAPGQGVSAFSAELWQGAGASGTRGQRAAKPLPCSPCSILACLETHGRLVLDASLAPGLVQRVPLSCHKRPAQILRDVGSHLTHFLHFLAFPGSPAVCVSQRGGRTLLFQCLVDICQHLARSSGELSASHRQLRPQPELLQCNTSWQSGDFNLLVLVFCFHCVRSVHCALPQAPPALPVFCHR